MGGVAAGCLIACAVPVRFGSGHYRHRDEGSVGVGGGLGTRSARRVGRSATASDPARLLVNAWQGDGKRGTALARVCPAGSCVSTPCLLRATLPSWPDDCSPTPRHLPGPHLSRASCRGNEVWAIEKGLGAGAVLVGPAGGRTGVVGQMAVGIDEGRGWGVSSVGQRFLRANTPLCVGCNDGGGGLLH